MSEIDDVHGICTMCRYLYWNSLASDFNPGNKRHYLIFNHGKKKMANYVFIDCIVKKRHDKNAFFFKEEGKLLIMGGRTLTHY